MEVNEIKSFIVTISLGEYLKIDSVITDNTFQVGNVKYYKSSTKLNCFSTSSVGTYLLLGRNVVDSNLYLFERGNNIIECSINNIKVNVECVLKKQIQHLKYVEQLKLFEDGEKNNG